FASSRNFMDFRYASEAAAATANLPRQQKHFANDRAQIRAGRKWRAPPTSYGGGRSPPPLFSISGSVVGMLVAGGNGVPPTTLATGRAGCGPAPRGPHRRNRLPLLRPPERTPERAEAPPHGKK